MGKGKIILAVIVVVAIAAVAAYFFIFAEKFDHSKNHVSATADPDTFMPDPFEAEASLVWDPLVPVNTTCPAYAFRATDNPTKTEAIYTGPVTGLQSLQYKTYTHSANSYYANNRAEIYIMVFDTAANANAFYEGLPALDTGYSKFEKSRTDSYGNVYKFIDMNVVGYVKITVAGTGPTQNQINSMMADIETKIHNAAVPLP